MTPEASTTSTSARTESSGAKGAVSAAKRLAVPVARNAVKGAAVGVDATAAATKKLRRTPTDPGITILIYHRVGAGNGGQMDVTPELFDQQLNWLKANTRVLTLDDAVTELSANGVVSTDASRPDVVLTFDDGTTDWVDHVLPALTRHGVPATFYVATSFIDEQLPFPGDGVPLTWTGVTELASSELVTIGSHTHRHMLLDRLDPASLNDELDRSIEMLASHLGGASIDHFAYPKAVAGSPEAESAVKARFRSAVLAGTRANHRGVDLHRLHRSPIQASDGMGWFKRKALGGMRFEDDLRQWANRARYRGLSS